jgi:hypothetical protein
LYAVHVAYARYLAQVLLQACEVAEIYGFDDEVYVDGTVVSGAGIDALDVGAVFRDDGRELLQQTRAIVDENR